MGQETLAYNKKPSIEAWSKRPLNHNRKEAISLPNSALQLPTNYLYTIKHLQYRKIEIQPNSSIVRNPTLIVQNMKSSKLDD